MSIYKKAIQKFKKNDLVSLLDFLVGFDINVYKKAQKN